jgi:hypothetical protein
MFMVCLCLCLSLAIIKNFNKKSNRKFLKISKKDLLFEKKLFKYLKNIQIFK